MPLKHLQLDEAWTQESRHSDLIFDAFLTELRGEEKMLNKIFFY